MGAGRWDAKALARELECSERTVHRLIQTLGFANVPVYYDQAHQAYRVRRGFKFPGIDVPRQNLDSSPNESAATVDNMEPAVKQILSDGEAFLKSIRTFLRQLKKN
jgi:predicted DNA-binding transcriptional regulator YafY